MVKKVEVAAIACPLCHLPILVSWTIKKLPCGHCRSCGFQFFIRFREGVLRLREVSFPVLVDAEDDEEEEVGNG